MIAAAKPYIWIFTEFSALFAFAAAIFWLISTLVEEKADPSRGIGPGLDGYLVVLNADGKPIHFLKSYQKQSLWSRRAAWAASLAAVFQGIAAALG